MPNAIDKRTAESTIFGMGHQRGQLLKASLFVGPSIHFAKLGKDPFWGGHFSGGLVTAIDFKWPFRKDGGKAVGFLKSPAINEAVMATRTLHVDPQKNLRNVLGKLDFKRLAGIHFSPPFNPLDESLGG